MEKGLIHNVIRAQRRFFSSRATFPVYNRLAALKRLRVWIKNHERDIAAALMADLGKSEFEAYMTETGMVLSELDFIIRHLLFWTAEKKVRTPAAQFPARSFIKPEPYGCVLIMSPWNYPFQLSAEPLAGALAAGNTAIIKPSAYSPHTSALINRMAADCFDPGWVTVVEGGRNENSALLDEKFDCIFFTGSAAVGRLVMEKASRHLTPVSLELGGKSPVIVDETANIPLAARRLAFGKYLNAGQTCVAPDHVYVHESVRNRLIAELKKSITGFYGADPLTNASFPHIINRRHYNRLCGLLDSADIVCGGRTDPGRLVIEPTVAACAAKDSPLMGEEIFGPILPVITYTNLNDVITEINSRPKPLALYIFSEDRTAVSKVLRRVSFGGGCVNDTIIHLATPYMPFGGVGGSGMGSYHGKQSFDTFTHYKSIADKSTAFDLPIRYAPYSRAAFLIMKLFM